MDEPAATSELPALDEAEFDQLINEMVADSAPRVFAVVEEYGDQVDGRIAAWGIAFDDHAEVVGVDGKLRMRLKSPERALRGFGRDDDITARLVWLHPETVSGRTAEPR